MCQASEAVDARREASRALLAAVMGIPVVPKRVMVKLRKMPKPNPELDALVARMEAK